MTAVQDKEYTHRTVLLFDPFDDSVEHALSSATLFL